MIPTNIPEKIEVDVAGLKETGDSIKVGDLSVSKDIDITTSVDIEVVTIGELAKEEPKEGEAPVEGVDAPAAT